MSDIDNFINGLRRQREQIQKDMDSCDREQTLSRAVDKLQELRDRADVTRAQENRPPSRPR